MANVCSRSNLKKSCGLALLALGAMVLGGCQSGPTHVGQGTTGTGYQSAVRHAASAYDSSSDALEARHPNRATREPQFIPN